jgi:hypothetical protein
MEKSVQAVGRGLERLGALIIASSRRFDRQGIVFVNHLYKNRLS